MTFRLCAIASAKSVTNNGGDIASHAIILELFEDSFEKQIVGGRIVGDACNITIK